MLAAAAQAREQHHRQLCCPGSSQSPAVCPRVRVNSCGWYQYDVPHGWLLAATLLPLVATTGVWPFSARVPEPSGARRESGCASLAVESLFLSYDTSGQLSLMWDCSVCWHLVSPASRGLFSAAIMESGTCDSAEFFVSEARGEQQKA